jgi:hypothetical protein
MLIAAASYGRGEGGQFAFVTKPGTNALHGALYEYLQNNDLNANTWDRNRVGIPNPKLEDNRFGVAVGGPIWKNRTFIFGSYEGIGFRSRPLSAALFQPTLCVQAPCASWMLREQSVITP